MSIAIRNGFEGLGAKFAQTSRLKPYVESGRDKAVAVYDWLETKYPTVFHKDSKITPLAILAIPAFVLYATPWRFMEMAFVGYHVGRFALNMWQRRPGDTKISAIIEEAFDSLKEPLKKMSFLEPYIQKIVVTCTEIEEKHLWLKDPRIISVAMSVISVLMGFNGMLRHCVTVGLVAKLFIENKPNRFTHLNEWHNPSFEIEAKVKVAQLTHIVEYINESLKLKINISSDTCGIWGDPLPDICEKINQIGDGLKILYNYLLEKRKISEIEELPEEKLNFMKVKEKSLGASFSHLKKLVAETMGSINQDIIKGDIYYQVIFHICH